MDFPTFRWPPLNIITPWHPESYGSLVRAGGTVGIANTSSVANVADRARYYPFTLFEPAVAKKIAIMVGTTNTGNFDVGIYDWAGNRIINSGSTAVGTTNTAQEIDITDTTLAPGRYWMAMQASSASSACFQQSIADEINMPLMHLYTQAVGSFGLPTSFTLAPSTEANPPVIVMGVMFDTLL